MEVVLLGSKKQNKIKKVLVTETLGDFTRKRVLSEMDPWSLVISFSFIINVQIYKYIYIQYKFVFPI